MPVGAMLWKLLTFIFNECLELAKVLLPGKPFHPNLKGASKPKAYPSEAPIRCTTQGEAPANIRQGWKSLPGINTLTEYNNKYKYKLKSKN